MSTETIVKRTTMRGVAVVLGMAAMAAIGTIAAQAHADEPEAAPSAAGVVNINTATADQLGLLPGIGDTKARAIIEHRTRRPFARVDDIVAVRGIGRATLRRLRPYLAVRGETTLTRPVTVPRESATANAPQAARAGAAARAPAARR